MKHAKHLLLMVATLLCSVAVNAEGITAVSQLSNETLYFVSQPYRDSTSWAIIQEQDALKCNAELGIAASQEDSNQQFAFISNDGGATHYLYHPVKQKFVDMDGSLNAMPENPVYFTAGAYENTFVVYFDNTHFINIDDTPSLVINAWGPDGGGGWKGCADGGNSCAIIPVGEFDPTAALEMFSKVEKEYTIELAAGSNGWVSGAEWYDQTQAIVGYTSPLYRFQDKVETLRVTVSQSAGNTKYFCLSELEFYDADGQKIALTSDAITSNADHNALNAAPDGGGIPALLDGKTSTYFHSAWQNMPADDHYLEVTLPDGGYDAFSFRMLSRAKSDDYSQSHTFPGQMVITTKVAPVVAELPEGVVNDLSAADPTKCYTIVTKGRGAWAVDSAATRISCTAAENLAIDASDMQQQFALLSANDEDYYLYSVSAEKFVAKDGSLVAGVTDALAFTDASSIAENHVLVSFRDYTDGYINIDDRVMQLVITSWNRLDDGNAVLISEAGDFDATKALAMLSTPEVPDTPIVEPVDWAGVYTVRTDELEVLHDAFTASDSFEMEVVYNKEEGAYYVTKMLGYDLTTVSAYGIPFTPLTENPNEAEIMCATTLAVLSRNEQGRVTERFVLRHVSLAGTPLTITHLEDDTFTISDFCVTYYTNDYTTNDYTETPAAYYRGVTAEVGYTQMPIVFRSGTDDNIEGWLWHDYDNGIVGYTSPLYRFEDKVETFRITVNKNSWGYKYFCLSELEFYDVNGNRIELAEANITSNADHNALNPNHLDGGGIPALFDGDIQTYFHSAWQNMPTGNHYLQITLPNGGYDAFSFRMLSRAYSVENGNTISHVGKFPAEMVIDIVDTSFRSVLEELLDRAKGYNAYSSTELGYYVEDFGYLLDAIAKADTLLFTDPSEAECEAMATELSQAVAQFEASDKAIHLPEPGKAYRIVSAFPGFYEQQSVEKAITINASDNTLWWGDLCADSLQQEFVFEPVLSDSGVHLSWNMDLNLSNGTSVSETQYFYNLKNVATGLYVSYNDSAKYHLADQPCTVYLTGLGIGQFGLRFRVENEYGGGRIHTVHAGDHNDGVPSDSIGDYGGIFGVSSGIVSWYAGLNSASAWYIRESSTQTDTVPPLELVGVSPDSETSESRVRALRLSFNKEVTFTLPEEGIVVRGSNTGAEFTVREGYVVEDVYGWHIVLNFLDERGAYESITAADTYTYTIPAGAIESVDGEVFPETTFTFTVYETFPLVSFSPYECSVLETIVLTFDREIVDVNMPVEGLTVTDLYYTPVTNVKNDVTISEDKKSVILELESPITVPGRYFVHVYTGVFLSEDGMESGYAALDFTVVEDMLNTTLPGDVNSDGSYTMSDVVMMVNAVLEKEQTNFNAAVADMNGDGAITMSDVVGVLRLVLGDESAMAPARNRSAATAPVMSAGEFAAMGGGRVVLPVALNNSEDYSAFQLDVVLPAGVKLAEATLTGRAKAGHTVAWNTLADGSVRVVAYAVDNASFRGNEGALLNLVLEATDKQAADAVLTIEDGLFATIGGAEHRAADVSVMMRAETTGIDDACAASFRVCGVEGAVEIVSGADAVVSIYAVTGQLVNQTAVKAGKTGIVLPAGVYMVNGNKVIVK